MNNGEISGTSQPFLAHINCASNLVVPAIGSGAERRPPTTAGGIFHRAVAISLYLGVALASYAHTESSKTNTVLLSNSAAEKMGTLISVKPGRAAKDIAATGSMRPVLDENYIVIVEERRFEDLAFGDIVVFRGDWNHGKPVAHRLVHRSLAKRAWQTKGDHCQGIDPQYLTEDKYKGFVVVAAVHKTTGQVKEFQHGETIIN